MSLVPYYNHAGITIYCGDCAEILPTLQASSVGLVLTNPPYNVRSSDIDLEGRSAMKRDFGTWDEDWSPAMLLTESLRVLRLGGSLLSFTSDRLLSAYREAVGGWKPRGTLVWVKTNPAPHPRPAYVQATEFIVWLQKDGAPAVWNGTGYTLNVLTFNVCSGDERGKHPTQKPEALVLDIMRRHADVDDVVLDPYMGSGTTLFVAKSIGRRCIGIERDEKYCAMAAARLSQNVLEFGV